MSFTSDPLDSLRVTYQLRCAPGEEVRGKATGIALEQTAELPAACLSPELRDRVVGRVETVDPLPDGRWEAVIGYPRAVLDDLPQLLNVLYGNISLKAGIRVASVEWPPSLLAALPGPRFGVDGLRALCGARTQRPLVCAALKPVGLPPAALADLAYRFASAGVDMVKDDHGLADQPSAPFGERVALCQEAVQRANRETGGASRYFPNVTSGFPALPDRVAAARGAGCRGVLVSPLLLGLDAMRWLTATSDLALLAHPTGTGAFFHSEHGIAPEVLLGDLFRMAGADGVIYPNAGGRFPFSEAVCARINARLRGPLGTFKPALPVPGGGIDVARVSYWIDRYGADMMVLIGGSFYLQPDPAAAAAELVATIRRQFGG